MNHYHYRPFYYALLLLLNAQLIDAQTISEVKYANGQPKIRYHIRQKDTFKIENLFENGKFHSILWQDSAYYYYYSQVIYQKKYGKRRLVPNWMSIAENQQIGWDWRDRNDYAQRIRWQIMDSLTYHPNGQLRQRNWFQGDSLLMEASYDANGGLEKWVQYEKKNNHTFNSLEINGIHTKHFSTDTLAKTQKRTESQKNGLASQETWLLNRNCYSPQLMQQTLTDSAGKVVFEWIVDQSNYIVDKDNGLCLYGFRNRKGDWVIPPKYESIEWLDAVYYIANEKNKYGIIDTAGRTVVPFEWDFLEELKHLDNQLFSFDAPKRATHYNLFRCNPIQPNKTTLFRCRKNNLFGVIDYKGKIVLEPVYQDVRQYYNGLYEVKIGKYWGIVDGNGKRIVAPNYVRIGFTQHKDLFVTADTTSLFDTYGEYKTGVFKLGLVNDKGNILLPCVFNSLRIDTPYHRAVWINTNNRFEGKLGLFHIDKGWILDTKRLYNPTLWWGHSGKYKVIQRYDTMNRIQYGLLDMDGDSMFLSFDYQCIRRISRYNSYYNFDWTRELFCQKQDKWGVFDTKKHQWLLPIQYDQIVPFMDSVYLVSHERKWQFVNSKGQPLLSETFEQGGVFDYYNKIQNKNAASFEFGKAAYMIRNNQMIFYNEYSFPNQMSFKEIQNLYFGEKGKIAIIGSDSTQWHINRDGTVLLSPQHKEIIEDVGYRVVQHQSTHQQQIIDVEGNIKPFFSKYNILKLSIFGNYVIVQDTSTNRIGMFTLGIFSEPAKNILPTQFFGITPPDEQNIIWGRKDFSLFKPNTEVTIKDDSLGRMDGDWQMYDKNGKLLSNVIFDYAFQWANHLGVGQVNGKQGLWNTQGKNILAAQYDKIFYDMYAEVFYLFKWKGTTGYEVGFANVEGQIVIDISLKNMSAFSGENAFVETANGYGIIQKNGQYLIHPQPYALQQADFSLLNLMMSGEDSLRNPKIKTNKNQVWWFPPFNKPYLEKGAVFLDTLVGQVKQYQIENILLESVLPSYFLMSEKIPCKRNRDAVFCQTLNFHVYDMTFFKRHGGELWHNLYAFEETWQKVKYTNEIIAMYKYVKIPQKYGVAYNYTYHNFRLKNNIWKEVQIEDILFWNPANVTALNQLMFQKINALKYQPVHCDNPAGYMESVKHSFYILHEGVQFFIDSVPILFTWAELKPFLRE